MTLGCTISNHTRQDRTSDASLLTEISVADFGVAAGYNCLMTSTVSANTIAEFASLVGDPARANILLALMDGRALTASELALHAGVGASTASEHLSKLTRGALVAMDKQGRHRYYRLRSPDVALAIEALMAVTATGPKRYRPAGPKDAALRLARTCYDHLAGRLGVALSDSLRRQGHIILGDGAAIITQKGQRFFADFGVDVAAMSSKRPLCRTCLDWSERRPHLAGQLGAKLLERTLKLGWVARNSEGRALKITIPGRSGFYAQFRLRLDG